jgi:hypothetical protein
MGPQVLRQHQQLLQRLCWRQVVQVTHLRSLLLLTLLLLLLLLLLQRQRRRWQRLSHRTALAL